MTASTFQPDVSIEIAFGDGYSTLASARTWTDVSSYVEAQDAISITRGRGDELSDVAPSHCTIRLDNKDGRFTPGYAAGAYYPDVRLGRPIRVTAVWPLAGGVTYRRFTGYIDEIPVSWPDGTVSTVTVGATSRLARLGQTAEFRSVLEEEVLYDGPVMYYPLGEPEGSTSASNVSLTAQEPLTIGQVGAGGTITFGTSTGPPTDSLPAPTFVPSVLAGKFLGKPLGASLIADHVAFECWFSTPTDLVTMFAIGADVIGSDALALATSNTLKLAGWTLIGGALTENNSGATVTDSAVHHAVLKLDKNGGNYDETLMLDGAVVATDASVFTVAQLTAILAAGNPLRVGALTRTIQPLCWEGGISHVAVYSGATEVTTARFTEHYLAGSSGFEGESSDARIERLARLAGVPAAEISTEVGTTSSMTFGDTTGQSPVQAMLDVTHTENGLLFDAGDGTLTFHSRDHRYNPAIALSLNATTQQLERDLTPTLDDFGVVNDVTATNGTAIVRVVDQNSVDDRGTYRETLDLLTTSDLEVADAANYTVLTYAEPTVRIPSASVQLIVQPSADITSLLALELGDAITLAGLPSAAPASSVDFFVEGISEQIGFESWLMTLNLSPVPETAYVWQLGDPVYGALDEWGLAY